MVEAQQQHAIGKVVWVDITVPDAGQLVSFYEAVIGWSSKGVDMGEYQDFNMVLSDGGKTAAGVCHARGVNADLPPVWMPYVLVEDIKTKAAKVEAAGGKLVRPLVEYPDGTGMAAIRDPAGAVLTLYQVGGSAAGMVGIGETPEGQKPPIGSFVSIDLTVPDADVVRDFYETVIGWTHSGVDMGGYQDYHMMMPGAKSPSAGICHARGTNADLPPKWMLYVLVEDLDRSLQTAEQMGGKRISEVRDYGEIRFCAIQDPAGAVISLFQQG